MTNSANSDRHWDRSNTLPKEELRRLKKAKVKAE
jgi:hypothetical protein